MYIFISDIYILFLFLLLSHWILQKTPRIWTIWDCTHSILAMTEKSLRVNRYIEMPSENVSKKRDRLEYMINTSSNFEMFGILLCWYSVSAPPSGKNRFYSPENGVRHPHVPCGSGLWYLPPRCLNIRKEILLRLPQVKMSFLLQLYKTNKRVTALDEQKNNGYWDLLIESVEYALSQKWIAPPWLPTDIE